MRFDPRSAVSGERSEGSDDASEAQHAKDVEHTQRGCVVLSDVHDEESVSAETSFRSHACRVTKGRSAIPGSDSRCRLQDEGHQDDERVQQAPRV